MSDDILRELRALKETLGFVSERIEQLEQRLNRPPVASPAVLAPDQPPPPFIAPKPIAPPAPLPTPAPAKPTRSAQVETLETRIGRDWLNRVGVVSLVLGIAFFILYTFQYFGPLAKLATGFLIGGGLLAAGIRLERRATMRPYALGLIGGGWALLYFTTYAMHHIEEVRVVSSVWLDLLLLVGVAAGAVTHSLRYKSETITALALLLGFITTSISHVSYFTAASSLLLVASLSWIVVRQRWHALLMCGAAASYATFLLWIEPQIDVGPIVAVYTPNVEAASFWLKASFIGLYWVAYTAAALALNEDTQQRRNALLTITLVNGLLSMQVLISRMQPYYTDTRDVVLIAGGALHLALSSVAKRRRLPAVAAAHQMMGLLFVTVALPLRLTERWVSVLWTLEVAALTSLGLRFERRWYRMFAIGLAVIVCARLLTMDMWSANTVDVLGAAVRWRLIIGPLTTASFLAAAWCYRRYGDQESLGVEAYGFYGYTLAASGVLWLLLGSEAGTGWVPAAWALQGAATIAVGWWLADAVVRAVGVFGCALAAVTTAGYLFSSTWTDSGPWNPWGGSTVIAVFYGMSAFYRWVLRDRAVDQEQGFQHGFAAAATLLLTWLLQVEVNRSWLSVAWAIEAVALVGVGFALVDKTFRVCGLAVFAVLVLKILFVDLAGAETIYRILSFIMAGATLLAASYAYARYASRPTGPPDQEPPSS